MRYFTFILISLVMAASLTATGYFIRDGLMKIRSSDRYVTVKGLAEREVMADLAIWPIQFKVADNVLDKAQAETERQSALIKTFLTDNGIKDDEISLSSVTITDALANQYRSDKVATRYAIDKTILVRTNNVPAVQQAAQKTDQLIAKGILVGYGSLPQYSFTKLNDIKPEMIAAATRNAREAAQQFAKDSGAQVGAIRSANQGYFSISARDNIGNIPDSAALYKKVRVVSTVEYYIHD